MNNEIIFENGATSDEFEISKRFNDFFIKSIVEINAEIPIEEGNINTVNPNQIFKFSKVNVEQICEIAKKFTNKINMSQICNSEVWNDAMQYMGYFMSVIINESLEKGVFPDQWKLSMITPIPKVNNTNKCDQFRPINSMPNDEKIIECVVKEQILEYFNANNIITDTQSAYRTGYSIKYNI